ncbi:MAG: hypothetical protein JO288_19025 [Hyphomicrobiales bacterium]|nr:hypothetical protein [Hyphomicrobiales bacterium]
MRMMAFDGDDNGFQQALEETDRGRRALDHDSASGAILAAKALPLDLGQAPGGGGQARWGLAMSWTSEGDETIAHPPAPMAELAAVDPDEEAIAAELGIDTAPSKDQLTRRWRAFLWRNHPDRQPPNARGRANDRVAIANSLYDQARRRARKSG